MYRSFYLWLQVAKSLEGLIYPRRSPPGCTVPQMRASWVPMVQVAGQGSPPTTVEPKHQTITTESLSSNHRYKDSFDHLIVFVFLFHNPFT